VGKISTADQRRAGLSPVLIGWALCALSAQAASFEPAWGRDGMVVTSVGPAAAAGQAVLEQGGNAVDAAVAMAFAAAVAHPFSSGIGGGMFAVTHMAIPNETTALDARETAPAGASAEYYERNPGSIRSGSRSVGVPGFVQGVWALHQKYGTLPWPDLIQPAISLAEHGVPVSVWHQDMVRRVAPTLADFPETLRIQTVDGKAPPLGWMLKQADLAATLRIIQENGGQALAVGDIARKIEQATDGAVTELDLARYRVVWRDPVRGSYRGYELASMPPPSSGGVLLVQMLNVLERYDLETLGKDSSEYIHLLAGAMKLAYADRAAHLGDSDFYEVPVERLTSRAHADQQAARLRRDAPPTAEVQVKPPPDDAGTAHITVLDRHGNAVALTQTINTVFGSKITVPGTGIVLNNELDDFSIGAEIPNAWGAVGSAANAVAPGKRPLSSMTPTIVFKDGQAVIVLGSPMGTTIITSVLHALLNHIDFDLDAQRAVQSPRFHHQWRPDQISLEPEFPRDVRRPLEALGWKLQERAYIGAVQMGVYDRERCLFFGGADGRRDSHALGVNVSAVSAEPGRKDCARVQAVAAAAELN